MRSQEAKGFRRGETTQAKAAEVIGDLCYALYTEMRATDPVEVKNKVLDLMFYLEGLSATLHEDVSAPPTLAPPPAPPPEAVPPLNLMDAEPVIIKAEVTTLVPEAAPSWGAKAKVASMEPLLSFDTATPEEQPAPLLTTPSLSKPPPTDTPSWSKAPEPQLPAPSWSKPQQWFDEEDAFGARLRMALEATQDKRKWRM